MRDGVKLFTVIYTPRDASQKYPIMMCRTPYGVPYGANNFPGVLGPSRKFTEGGYIVVYQDVRGTHLSEGTYENMRPELSGEQDSKAIDESTDTYDTIDWLIKHVPNNNGRVGMWGISYPGFYAACGVIRAHPALKAASPQAPIADWFLGDDDHHNGAFYLQDNFSWDFGWGFDWPRTGPSQTLPTVDLHYNSDNAYDFYLGLGPLRNANERYFKGRVPFWNDLMAHETYDSYTKSHSLLPHLHDVRPALLLVSGWFDAEDFFGPFHIFHGIEHGSPQTNRTYAFDGV
jgi:putative CocE/NonD family hydrolase